MLRGRPATAKRPRAAGATLFDEEFQRKLDGLALVSRRVFAGRARAERRSKKKGSGVEFADHRPYVAGDDFRFVDWNIYQRFGRLLVRLYEEEEDLSIYFLVDCSGSMAFGDPPKFDLTRKLCAALAYVGLANLDRVTVVAVGPGPPKVLPAMRGKSRIFKVFRFLEGLAPEGETDLKASLTTFVAQHKRRGVAVLLSDLYDPAGFEGGINTLRYHKFEPYVLHLCDAPEEIAPAGISGDISVFDCETGQRRDVTLTEAMARRLADAQRGYNHDIETFCTRGHVPYFAVPAGAAFDELVLGVLRRGGVIR